jgi:S1-C subfamily serine protease
MLDLEHDMTQIVEKVRHSVVAVLGEKPVPRSASELGDAHRPPTHHISIASGVVLDEDGHILTTDSVARRSKVFHVSVEGESYPADVVSIDPVSQLAVLAVHGASNLVPLPIAGEDDLHVGSWVFVVGVAGPTQIKSSFGTVSTLPREDDEPGHHFLATTATISAGQSGAALVDSRGKLVGIAYAEVVSSAEESEIGVEAEQSTAAGRLVPVGTSLAIPADVIHDVAAIVRARGAITRGFLGVRWTPDEQDATLPTTLPIGVHVWEVVPGSPADKAGIRRGDVITAFNHEAVTSGPALRNRVLALSPGSSVPISLLRDGQPLSLAVVLDTLPSGPPDSNR